MGHPAEHVEELHKHQVIIFPEGSLLVYNCHHAEQEALLQLVPVDFHIWEFEEELLCCLKSESDFWQLCLVEELL